MYKKILVAISSLFLVTCASPEPESAAKPIVARSITQAGMDRYFFTGKQYEKRRVTIDLILYDNYETLGKKGEKYGLIAGPNEYIVAFSLDRLKGNRCEIHMIDPILEYRPEFTGHEMLHCFFGQFHGSNDSKG